MSPNRDGDLRLMSVTWIVSRLAWTTGEAWRLDEESGPHVWYMKGDPSRGIGSFAGRGSDGAEVTEIPGVGVGSFSLSERAGMASCERFEGRELDTRDTPSSRVANPVASPVVVPVRDATLPEKDSGSTAGDGLRLSNNR